MSVFRARYKDAWHEPRFVLGVAASLFLFILALGVNFWAIKQATTKAGPAVPDIILSNIPVFEVDGLFVYGTFVFVLFTAAVLLQKPLRIPFALHALTLFVLIRCAFTLMTHLGSPLPSYTSDFGETITNAFFGADQFFSGHTGMPFLGALAFWHVPWIRNVFLAATAYFVGVVLLGHIHYTIDVMSAFFITYGIFQIALRLFKKEREWFLRA